MEINQDLIMQWGLMNKLSTGHALLDTILVMLVPLLVNQLFPHIRTYVSALLSRWQSRPASKHHERMILHRVKDYYTSDEDMPNHKLQQAIMIHLNTLPDVFSQLQTADVRLAKTKRNDTRLGRSDAETSSSDGESASGGDWYPGEHSMVIVNLPEPHTGASIQTFACKQLLQKHLCGAEVLTPWCGDSARRWCRLHFTGLMPTDVDCVPMGHVCQQNH